MIQIKIILANGTHYINSDTTKSTPIRQFQRSISNNTSDLNVPKYFLHGKRVTNIIHTKLRHNCLLLNYD